MILKISTQFLITWHRKKITYTISCFRPKLHYDESQVALQDNGPCRIYMELHVERSGV